MKLFNHIIEKGADVTRVDDSMFSIFLVQNTFSGFMMMSYEIEYGWGNGYVGLPLWHPYYGMDYDNVPVSCHGGLTYGNLDEDENLWVIGFDTCHHGDNKILWSKEHVLLECRSIVEQCMNVKEVERIIKLNKINKLL